MASDLGYAYGAPCWVDLVTPTETTAASRFYCRLFGWQVVTSRRPLDDAGAYWTFHQDGKNVAGVGPPVHASRSGLPQLQRWTPYVCVADVHATSRRVAENDGTVLVLPRRIDNAGWLAIYQDPAGAEVAVWQPVELGGFEVADEPNSYALAELSCHDAETVSRFYRGVFGWDRQTEAWTLPGVDGTVARLVHAVGDEAPHWLIYFAVADTDATVTRALELGASVTLDPVDLAGRGRAAVLEDPQGATFAIVER